MLDIFYLITTFIKYKKIIEGQKSLNDLIINKHSNYSQIFQRLIVFDRDKFGKRQISLPPK